MAGRGDFGILKAHALGDHRVLRAAELYVERHLAREQTARAAVLGHLVLLGLWTSRETDDGVLPGDGSAAFSAATLTSIREAKKFIEVLSAKDVDLLTRTNADLRGPDASRACTCTPACADACARGPLRLRGFDDAYRPIIQAREKNADKLRKWRERKRNVTSPVTSSETSYGLVSRTEPNRTESPLAPFVGSTTGANGAANGHDAAPTSEVPGERAAVSEILAKLRGPRGGPPTKIDGTAATGDRVDAAQERAAKLQRALTALNADEKSGEGA